jgi:hypothetical protein
MHSSAPLQGVHTIPITFAPGFRIVIASDEQFVKPGWAATIPKRNTSNIIAGF